MAQHHLLSVDTRNLSADNFTHLFNREKEPLAYLYLMLYRRGSLHRANRGDLADFDDRAKAIAYATNLGTWMDRCSCRVAAEEWASYVEDDHHDGG